MLVDLNGKSAQSYAHATARLNMWDGSVRSAKTTSSILKWLDFVRHGPDGPLLMAGKTERTLKRNVLDPIIEMIGLRYARLVSGSGEFHLLGRRIYLAGANDERAYRKIQGPTFAGAYGDEVESWPESFFKMLGTRLSVPGAQFFGTMNPGGPNHWAKKNYLDRARLRIHRDGTVERFDGEDRLNLNRFSFTLDDNPHLPPAFVDDLKKEYSGLFYKRYILGLWVLAEGVIYDMFDAASGGRHVVSKIPEINRWFMAIDYGTTNPFVAQLFGIGFDKCLYITHEWRWDSKKRQRQLSDQQYSQKLKKWVKKLGIAEHIDRIYPDPTAKSFIVQMYEDGWHGVTPAQNAVLDGIRSVSSLLAADRLKIHESCKGLLDEIPEYCWNPKAQEKGDDAPIKLHDHSMDTMRYGVMGTRFIWRHWLKEII